MNAVGVLVFACCFIALSFGKDALYSGLTSPSSRVADTVFHLKDRNRRQAMTNTTTVEHDNHNYYTSLFHPPGPEADSLWMDLDELIGSADVMEQTNVTESVIQGLHRVYEIWELKFDFPFYGHTVDTLAVATGGFLYVGGFFHENVHLTQFIAPLQADFNPSLDSNSTILIYNTVDRFTVQWDNVINHDHNDAGPFTFQVSLFPNGRIHFVYREIPLLVSQINNDDHPVEVGLADAFYYDVILGRFIIRSIFEYSRIALEATDNLAFGAYVINPLPNCVLASSCTECEQLSAISSFDCAWCPTIQRCSDGIDRHRQEWIDNGCSDNVITECNRKSMNTSSSFLNLQATPTSIIMPLSSLNVILATPTTSYMTTPTSTIISIASPNTISTTPTTSISTTSSNSYITTSTSSTSTSIETTPTVTPTFTVVPSALSNSVIAGVGVVIIVVVVMVIVIFVVTALLMYGYKRSDSSKIGRLMVKYRPSAIKLPKFKHGPTATFHKFTEEVSLE